MINDEPTACAPRTRSEVGSVLSALARNMDNDNGLRIILNSLACMADYEHWNLGDVLNRMRQQWSESCENYQGQVDELLAGRTEERNNRDRAYATRDQIAADLATVQNEREKLLRELAEAQEAYRKARNEFDAAMTTAHEVQVSMMGERQIAYEDQIRLADVLRLKRPAAFDTLFVRDQCLPAIEELAINQKRPK